MKKSIVFWGPFTCNLDTSRGWNNEIWDYSKILYVAQFTALKHSTVYSSKYINDIQALKVEIFSLKWHHTSLVGKQSPYNLL